MLLMKDSVLSLKKNQNNKTTLRFTFKLPKCSYKSFMTETLNIIFDDFSMGYRIKFSCLYISQRCYFMELLTISPCNDLPHCFVSLLMKYIFV